MHYADPAAAARWLAATFGLTSWDRVPEAGEEPSWIELHIGNVAVLLFPLAGKRSADEPVTHTVWVYVDDLDAHFAHAKANGATIASEIHEHGYRSYSADYHEGNRWTFAQAPPKMASGA